MGSIGSKVGARLSFVVLALALVAGACGEAGPDLFEGATDGDPTELVGTWMTEAGTTWVMTAETITASGGSVTGVVESTYVADANTFQMNDIAGEVACDNAATGSYEWVIVEDQLGIRRVFDACGGRGAILDGLVFIRQ